MCEKTDILRITAKRFKERNHAHFSLRDIDEVFREIEEMMERELQKIIRERKLPNSSKIRERGPFVYGYGITIGLDRNRLKSESPEM